MAYPKNRKSSPRVGCNKGVPKPPIPRVCEYCSADYMGFNGTKYCSDVCVLKANCHAEGECWLWDGYVPKNSKRAGYGEFDFKSGKRMLAHRAAYLLLKGQDPGKRCVCHTCDNPRCINPDHLWLGSRDENMADRQAKERQARGETNASAKLTEANVRAIRDDSRPNRVLAREYGVFETTISQIKHRKTWKHVI